MIEYEPQPKRLYRIDGVEVPSVTEILRVLDKPALTWWGQNVGVSAMLQLHQRGVNAAMLLNGKPPDMDMLEWSKLISKQVLTKPEYQLTVNHIRNQASSRGLTVHTAFSYWAASGLYPAPMEFPEHEQGYVIALIKFLRDMSSLKPEGIELAVGSAEHGFAGRFDMRGVTSEPHEVVTKVYPKWPDKLVTIDPGLYLFDLKTSVDVFPEHALQLAAYELASVESGYSDTDGQLVIQLGADGRYQCREAHSSGEDFLAVKACFHALSRATEELKV